MKQTNKNTFLLRKGMLILSLVVIIVSSCKKDDEPSPQPAVTTTDVTSATAVSASSGGTIVNGSASITARGVCWSTNMAPTVADNKTVDGAGGGTFTSALTGLTQNTQYHVRAYVTTAKGTIYGDEKTFTTKTIDVDVFVAGRVMIGSDYFPAYWKNGKQHLFDSFQGADIGQVDALEVVVNGNDTTVYTAGVLYQSSYQMVLWKNGAVIFNTDGTHQTVAQDIAVNGSDVYICGFEYINNIAVAKFWKNGVATTLGDGVNTSRARSIYAKGQDVLVTYYVQNSGFFLWKNGTVTKLSANGDTNWDGNTKAIDVVGNDVYVTGYEWAGGQDFATYWKNGVATHLSTSESWLGGVNAYNGDIYTCGIEKNASNEPVLKIWKNWTEYAVLAQGNDAQSGYGIDASSGHVYVTSEMVTPNNEWRTILWKDGQKVAPFDGSTNIFANQLVVLHN